jgi:hypothetical protein
MSCCSSASAVPVSRAGALAGSTRCDNMQEGGYGERQV